MHACGGEPSARDAFHRGEEIFVGFDGVIDAALCGGFEPLLVAVDEDGHGLVVDQKLCEDVPEFARAENGDVRTFGDFQPVDDGFADGDDPRKERFGIRNGGGERGKVFLVRDDEVAHVSLGVDARDLHVSAGVGIAGEALIARTAGNGVVDEHAGIFFDFDAGGARFSHDAHGKPSGHERVFGFRRAAIGAQFGVREQNLRDFYFRLGVLCEIVRSFFRGQDFGGKDFPNHHSTPFFVRERGLAANSRMKYYNATFRILQANAGKNRRFWQTERCIRADRAGGRGGKRCGKRVEGGGRCVFAAGGRQKEKIFCKAA